MEIERVIGLIDLTTLGDNDTNETVERLCHKAVTPYGSVAAVCLYPKFVSVAKDALSAHPEVKIATVVNFPHGNDDIEAAVKETREAVDLGADEIDFVFPYRRNPIAEADFCRRFVQAVRGAAPSHITLKAILETGEMADEAKIAAASTICLEEGVKFLKTSTGKVTVGATPSAAQAMCKVLSQVNPQGGFKASGGVRTFEDCQIYLDIAEKELGPKFLNSEQFRFGASGLLDNLLEKKEGSQSTIGSSSHY